MKKQHKTIGLIITCLVIGLLTGYQPGFEGQASLGQEIFDATSRRTVIIGPDGAPVTMILPKNATASNGQVSFDVTELESPVKIGSNDMYFRDNGSGRLEFSNDNVTYYDYLALPYTEETAFIIGEGAASGMVTLQLADQEVLRYNKDTGDVEINVGGSWEEVGGSITVTDTITTVNGVTTIEISGGTVTEPVAGTALITVTSGGTGDMEKSVYDTNSNNIVDEAESCTGCTGGGGTGSVVNATAIITTLDTPKFIHDMWAAGEAVGSIPIGFSVGEDPNEWTGEHTIEVTAQYWDEGTDDLEITIERDTGTDTVTLATKTNTLTWLDASTTIEGVPGINVGELDAVLYLKSDTLTPGDPIVDTSPQAHVIVNVDATHSTTAPKYGQSSFALGGFTVTDPGDLHPGTEAFTMMFWARFAGDGWQFLGEEGSDDNWFFGWYNGQFTLGYPLAGSAEWAVPGATGLNDSQWHHYYVGSDGAGTLYCFIDGVNKQTTAYVQWGVADSPLEFGTQTDYPTSSSGMDDFYYVKGKNLYTDPFTPPPGPVDGIEAFKRTGTESTLYLVSDTASASDPILDDSHNGFSIINTNGDPSHDPTNPQIGLSSFEFDGNDWVEISDAAWDANMFPGTDPFTFAWWARQPSVTGQEKLIGKMDSGTLPYNAFEIGHANATGMYIGGMTGITNNYWAPTTPNVSDDSWHYYTFSGDGATLYFTVDGGNLQTTSYTGFVDNSANFRIGCSAPGTYCFSGYVQDFFYLKGTALYTTTHTPPTLLKKDDPAFNVTGATAPLFDGGVSGSDLQFSTSSGSPLYLRSVSIRDIDTEAIALYEPYTTISGAAGAGDPTAIILASDMAEIQTGVYAAGDADGTANPVYFTLGSVDPDFWGNGAIDRSYDITLKYLNEGTGNIDISFYRSSGEDSVSITKTDTGAWVETTVQVLPLPGAIQGDLSISSDTATAVDPIVDGSPNAFTVVENGDPDHDPATPHLGISSIYLDGNDGLTIGHDAALAPGSTPFTYAMWIKSSTGGHQKWYVKATSDFNGLEVAMYNGSLYVDGFDGTHWEPGITGLSDGNWHYITVCGDGATVYVMADGTNLQTKGYTTLNDVGADVRIGFDNAGAYSFTGHVQDIFFDTGTASYTTTFTPPTLLKKDDPAFTAASASGLLFEGDYTANGNADLKIETDDNSPLWIASIEIQETTTNSIAIWQPALDTGVVSPIAPLTVTDTSTSVSNVDKISFPTTYGFLVVDDGNGDVTVQYSSSWNPIQVAGQTDLDATGEEALEIEAGAGMQITTNTGTTPKKLTFTNTGIPDATAIHSDASGEISTLTQKSIPGSTDKILIEDADAGYVKKYVQVGDLSSGGDTSAVTFLNIESPPGETQYKSHLYVAGPQPPDSSTSLLIHSNTTEGSTVFIDSSSFLHTITAFGNAHHTTAQQMFGTSAAVFDGSGDYLTIPIHTSLQFAAEDFTIDFWYRTPSSLHEALLIGNVTWTDQQFALYYVTGGLSFQYSTDGSSWVAPPTVTWTPSVSTWYHIAVVRNGADLMVFVDGTQLGTTYDIATSSLFAATSDIYIGYDMRFSGTYDLDGHLDEIRVSKGIARWTTAFTPPTSAYGAAVPQEFVFKYDTGETITLSDLNDNNITFVNTPYTLTGTDDILHVDSTVGPLQITVPTILITAGVRFSVKDGGGLAGTNTITIVGQGGELIDGAANKTITVNYDSVSFYSYGGMLYTIK